MYSKVLPVQSNPMIHMVVQHLLPMWRRTTIASIDSIRRAPVPGKTYRIAHKTASDALNNKSYFSNPFLMLRVFWTDAVEPTPPHIRRPSSSSDNQRATYTLKFHLDDNQVWHLFNKTCNKEWVRKQNVLIISPGLPVCVGGVLLWPNCNQHKKSRLRFSPRQQAAG